MFSVEHRHVSVRMAWNGLDNGYIASQMVVAGVGMFADDLDETRRRKAWAVIFCRDMALQFYSAGLDGLPYMLCTASEAMRLCVSVEVSDSIFLFHMRSISGW